MLALEKRKRLAALLRSVGLEAEADSALSSTHPDAWAQLYAVQRYVIATWRSTADDTAPCVLMSKTYKPIDEATRLLSEINEEERLAMPVMAKLGVTP